MATFSGSPRPLMGRYTLLPSASSWETVSEEAEGSLGMTEGYSLMLSNPLRNIGEEQSSQKYMSVTAEEPEHRKKLSTFFGVVVPVTLSMFSVILFLRLGFVVGQAGLVLSIGMFVIAYFVVGLTILSISAIATNGAVKEGGAYYMISRTLGPEFGGSIGVIFYFANIFASALYLLGFVEALLNNFQESSPNIFRSGTWYSFLYASIVLFFCLIVCLIGSGMFAKTSFIIFLAVMVAVSSSIVSFLIVKHKDGISPGVHSGHSPTKNVTYRYSGWNSTTLHKNLWPNFTKDYTTEEHQTSLTVFGVLFNGVTGVMAGANISGDLKKPGYAIPFGTLGASVFTFIVYLLLVVFTSATCPRSLLRNNYNYLKEINKVEWLITMGTFAATLSAALSCLIGASRILQAIAKDDLLGVILRPFSKVTHRNGEPLRAVLMSWFFVQSALMVILFVVISLRTPPTPWGDVSQALIYHQVRKYLLRLDLRKDHVKFWRPQVLLLVSNPRSGYPLIDFVNDIKKGGLYILGHVQEGEFDAQLLRGQKRELTTWLNFVDCTEIKAFVELTIARTIRAGARNLLMASGLGGMKPNTLILGFYDHELPVESFSRGIFRKPRLPFMRVQKKDEIYRSVQLQLPPLRTHPGHQKMTLKDYVGIIKDAVLMDKNVCIARNFAQLDKNALGREGYIDVWPMNTTVVGEGEALLLSLKSTKVKTLKKVLGPYDFTFLLTLQLSCVLHMVPFWENRSKLRVMQIVETEDDEGNHQTQHRTLTNLLKELRIPAEVRMIHVTQESLSLTRNADGLAPSTNWYRTVNQLIRIHSTDAFVVFTGLPHPPNEENMAQQFIQDITVLSDNLPPVMMVYGKSKVVSTSL
ncbi:solute carrier family 12 member 9-like [Pocillopora damicornis]|uniref:solute carrier family 12 member 9-like n=1 Tax=Pocillopora damicornis TaxID=46731 RepID=UPI000F54F681|nr:solute carrier family 12 member 9-like [Pocillopora damicornis]